MFTSLLHPFRLVREGKKMSLWGGGTRDLVYKQERLLGGVALLPVTSRLLSIFGMICSEFGIKLVSAPSSSVKIAI